MKKNILLLNPPGDNVYLRDCYCSTVAKASYCWHPLDLLIQSGILAEDFNVFVLDANVLRLKRDETLRRISKIDLDAILFLIGSLSWWEDLRFIEVIKKKWPKVKLIGSGEVLRFDGLKVMKQFQFIDGILLDFTSDSILRFINDKKNGCDIDNFIYRAGVQIVSGDINSGDEFEIPIPKHEYFPLNSYKLPFGKRIKMASILSTYGCPYKCKFCNAGALGFKERKIDNFIEELSYIKSLGIKKVFIRDATFGVDREYAKELCERIIKNGIQIEWNCFSRVDVVDEELLRLMKEAGCYLIQAGIESADEQVLKECNKGINNDKIIETFKYFKQYKIDVCANFILGLPTENHESIYKTFNLAKRLDPTYVSFNILTPRFGSPYREEYFRKTKIDTDNCLIDDDYLFAQNNSDFFRNDLIKLKNKIVIKFYLRPGYIWNKLVSVRSLGEFLTLVENSTAIIKGLIKP